MDTEQKQLELQRFTEDMGLFFENLGLSRIAGKILGWLLICNPPHQTMYNLVEAVHASKASISNNTRLLIQMGFIERISLPGYRPDHYRIKSGAWIELTKRRSTQITTFRQLAERGLELLGTENPELQTRLAEMRELYAFFEREFPPLLEQWEQEHQINYSGVVSNGGINV